MENARPVSLLAAKLCIPPARRGLVARSRLLARLNAGLARRLTLISAPAGFGKTTLLSAWIANHGSQAASSEASDLQFVGHPVRFCWLSLDEDDNDPVRFWRYVIAALETAHTGVGETGRALLGVSPPPNALMPGERAQWGETALTAMLNDLTADRDETEDGHLVLALDDYHAITAQAIHDSVSFLLDHLPPQMHIVILTRADPPLPLARLRARGQLTEIRAVDLRFTSEEAAVFLNQAMELSLSKEDVAALEKCTEGWITGLQLAALSMQGRESAAEFIAAFDGSHRYVMDYLFEEVLRRQPEKVREFLLQTAIPDQLTASLCDALTGRSDGQEMLVRLERANLFLVPLDDRREQYRYHHLFSDFLRAQVEAAFRSELHRRTAQWCASQGSVDQAVRYALASGDMALAGRLIRRAAGGALERGQLSTLLGWLNALPDDDVRSDSVLAGYKAWALELSGQTDEAESYLNNAERHLPAEVPDWQTAQLATIRAYIAQARRDIAGTIAASQRALQLVHKIPQTLHCAILHILAVAQFSNGEVETAAQNFSRSYEIGRESGAYFGGIMSLTCYAWMRLEQGRRREVVRLCEQAIHACVDARGNPLPLAGYAHIFLGQACYQANWLEEARQHLVTGLDLITRIPYREYIVWGKVLLTRVCRALGDEKSANAAIGEAYEAAADSEWYRGIVQAFTVHPDPQCGDLAAGVLRLEAEGLSPYDVPQPRQRLFYMVYGRALLAVGRTRDAQTVLISLEELVRRPDGLSRQYIGSIFGAAIEILVLQAVAHQALENETEAIAKMEQALRQAALEDSRRVFLEAGPTVADLVRRARRAAPDFADRLLDDFAAETRRRTISDQPLIEPLTAREIEVLRLIATGLRNKEIADHLCLSVGTVKRHISNINGKLGTNNRTQAIARARELHIL